MQTIFIAIWLILIIYEVLKNENRETISKLSLEEATEIVSRFSSQCSTVHIAHPAACLLASGGLRAFPELPCTPTPHICSFPSSEITRLAITCILCGMLLLLI